MGWFKSKNRDEDFRACANALGWQFKPEDKGLLSWLLDFKLFKLGGGKKISPVIIKEEDD
jgi:hypothetical protein